MTGYQYDSLYRLVNAKETQNGTRTWEQGFTYDRYGNRLSHDKFIGASQIAQTNLTHPTIDANTNRFTAGQGYAFDKNGNLVTDPADSGRSFVFNGDNKQKEVRGPSNELIGEYFYDGEGRRVKKHRYVGGVLTEVTVFVYSAGKLAAEYSTAPPEQNPTTKWTVTDQLGSPRVLVDSLGQVVSRRDFMPFGEEITPDGTHRNADLKYSFGDNIRQKFTGYQKDEETQLDFAEARMYQNLHGRFTAVDPLLASGKSANPQTFNRYVYVMNNPLIYTDPTGLQAGNYTGSVYYKVLEDGRWAFSDRPGVSSVSGINYENRYTGGRVRITGVDGYQYTVSSRGWRQHGLDVVAARGRSESTPQSPKSQDAINTALLKDLGMRAPATQQFLFLLMASGAAGGAGAASAVGTGGVVFASTVVGEALLAEQGLRQLGEAQRESLMMGSIDSDRRYAVDQA